jgi:hypothetical protein
VNCDCEQAANKTDSSTDRTKVHGVEPREQVE